MVEYIANPSGAKVIREAYGLDYGLKTGVCALSFYINVYIMKIPAAALTMMRVGQPPGQVSFV